VGEKTLSAKHRLFIHEYLADKELNATQAAIRAGYSPRTAQEQASRLLKNERIKAEIEKAMGARQERLGISQDRVLEELWNVVTADTNDLMELRRRCCRHCWGKDFKYQFTKNEMQQQRNNHALTVQKAMEEGKSLPEFDPLGGIGYDARRDPNHDCPECFGEGVVTPFFKDTRKLPKNVRALYAGVKITKDGIEVKTHSKDKYIEMVGRHLGMFKDKVEVEVTGSIAEQLKAAREARQRGAK